MAIVDISAKSYPMAKTVDLTNTSITMQQLKMKRAVGSVLIEFTCLICYCISINSKYFLVFNLLNFNTLFIDESILIALRTFSAKFSTFKWN
jgi:hypothetical protein